jgi:hypothetical protein
MMNYDTPDLGVDRYGRPSQASQNSPYRQRPQNNPAAQRPDQAHQQPQQTSAPHTMTAPPPQQPQYQTRMEGFEQSKLQNQQHAQDSPKYAFGQTVQSGNYGYQDGQRLLQDLQARYPHLYGGWQYQNDKFRYTGDPNQLHQSWNGVTEVDFVRNFSQGGQFDPNQAAFWWGAGGGNAPAPGGPGPVGTLPPPVAMPVPGGPGPGPDLSGIGKLPTYTPHQFKERNLPSYQPTQFSQFQAPDFSQFQPGQDALIQQMLANPESMGANTVNQMKAGQSEAMARMLQDAQARMGQSAVGRGALGGLAAGARRLNESALSDLLGAHRDIDIEAAKTNFNDRLNTMGAVEGNLASRLGRAVQGYGATLQGQTAQDDAQRFAIQSALQNEQFDFNRELAQADENRFGYGSQADATKFELDKALGIGGLNIQQGQLGLDGQRLAETIRQFNMTFPESQRQFNAQMGFNWGQLGANQQSQLINTILSGRF